MLRSRKYSVCLYLMVFSIPILRCLNFPRGNLGSGMFHGQLAIKMSHIDQCLGNCFSLNSEKSVNFQFDTLLCK